MSKNNPEIVELKQLNLDLALRLERYEQQLRRMQLINDIAEASNSTSSPQEAVRQALAKICNSTGWPLAHAYFAREGKHGTELVSSHIWHIREGGNFDEFIELTEALRFRSGQGLPGVVLRDREALWTNAIRSDARRFALGRKIGIQSAFGFPVMIGDRVAAILEFFSGQNLAPDEILLDIVSQLGMLLGRVFERARAAEERATLNEQVITASRRAGMAEVASGVLHDVGNVLNSITVSSNLLRENLQKSSVQRIEKVAGLFRGSQGNLAEFLSDEKKVEKMLDYIDKLSNQLLEEQNHLKKELQSLLNNVAHVKNIIRRQQDYATPSSMKEPVQLNELIEDALKINNLHSHAHEIKIHKELGELPIFYADKHNLIQIFNNLICNAKQALNGKTEGPQITVRSIADPETARIKIDVEDNGCGIAKNDQKKIFQFGFTTKAHGHGFGLHTSANTAQAMGGSLTFESAGSDQGTTFTLTLPYKPKVSPEGEIAA